MQTTEQKQIIYAAALKKAKQKVSFDERGFFPSGAIAFFIGLLLLGLVFWFGIYFLMITRM